MKKVLPCILAALLLSHHSGATDGITTDYGKLDSLLTLFYANLTPATVDEKCAEFDGLISACHDSLTRQHVAMQIFEHYQEPPVMGDEEVAVRIYDKWFGSGLVSAPGEFGALKAKMFADFNRSTLLGCSAPVLALLSPSRKKVTAPTPGKTSILFFYDTDCSKCRLEAKVLPGILEGIDFPVDFLAVYAGSNTKSWAAFRRGFKVKNRNVTVRHLHDPEIESNYIKLYAVISTPKMFIVSSDGTVIGRRLEPESLQQLLPLAKTIAETYEKTQKLN